MQSFELMTADNHFNKKNTLFIYYMELIIKSSRNNKKICMKEVG